MGNMDLVKGLLVLLWNRCIHVSLPWCDLTGILSKYARTTSLATPLTICNMFTEEDKGAG